MLEKMKRGVELIRCNDHKLCIGVAMAVIGTSMAVKVFKKPEKYCVDTKPFRDGERDGFAIRTLGINRFGKECYRGPWVCCCGEDDKDYIMSNIEDAINGKENRNYTT